MFFSYIYRVSFNNSIDIHYNVNSKVIDPAEFALYNNGTLPS